MTISAKAILVTPKKIKDGSSHQNKRDIYGFILYLIIFIGLLPFIFKRYVPTYFMYYMANVDIIANILTNIKDPKLFGDLYLSDPQTLIQYISVIAINYIALLSIFYVVIKFHNKTTTVKAIAIAGVMTLVTFLLPTYVIPYVIEKLEQFYVGKTWNKNLEVILLYITAIGCGLLFILVEERIITNFILGKH